VTHFKKCKILKIKPYFYWTFNYVLKIIIILKIKNWGENNFNYKVVFLILRSQTTRCRNKRLEDDNYAGRYIGRRGQSTAALEPKRRGNKTTKKRVPRVPSGIWITYRLRQCEEPDLDPIFDNAHTHSLSFFSGQLIPSVHLDYCLFLSLTFCKL